MEDSEDDDSDLENPDQRWHTLEELRQTYENRERFRFERPDTGTYPARGDAPYDVAPESDHKQA